MDIIENIRTKRIVCMFFLFVILCGAYTDMCFGGKKKENSWWDSFLDESADFLEKAGGEVLDYGLKELKRSGGQIVKAGLGAVMRGEGLEGALEAVEKRSRSELKRVARSAAKDAVSYAGKELKSLTQKNVGEINSELSGIAVEISMLKNLRSGNGGWLPDQYREKLKALEEERDYLESKLDWASIGNKAFKGVVNVGEKLARSAIEDELGFEEEEDDDLLGSLLGGW